MDDLTVQEAATVFGILRGRHRPQSCHPDEALARAHALDDVRYELERHGFTIVRKPQD